jgi:hypothetical protein
MVVDPAGGHGDITPCPGSIGISGKKKGEKESKKNGPLIVGSGP